MSFSRLHRIEGSGFRVPKYIISIATNTNLTISTSRLTASNNLYLRGINSFSLDGVCSEIGKGYYELNKPGTRDEASVAL